MASWADSAEFVLYIGYGLVGLAVFVVARMLMQEEERSAAEGNLDDNKRRASDPLVRLTKPFFAQYILPKVRGKPFWDVKRRSYKRKLIAAGLKDELSPDEMVSFKLFLILFFPVVAIFLKAGDFLDLEWYYIAGSTAAGWWWPDLWVSNRIKARQKLILKAMPFTVDLLALSTEAGLDFIGAIGKVVDKATPGPLVEEFSQLLREIKVGSSRQDALREMAHRIDLTAVNSFVAILISADQMGASIGKILRQQSDQIRTERLVRAEKAGAAAAQKVMIPLVMLILPAVMLLVFGPFILSYINGGEGG